MDCDLNLLYCIVEANLVQFHIHRVVNLTYKENTGWSLLKFGIILQKVKLNCTKGVNLSSKPV